MEPFGLHRPDSFLAIHVGFTGLAQGVNVGNPMLHILLFGYTVFVHSNCSDGPMTRSYSICYHLLYLMVVLMGSPALDLS